MALKANDQAIRDRIKHLQDHLALVQQLVSGQSAQYIPKSIIKNRPSHLIDELCLNGDWTYRGNVIDLDRSVLVNSLALQLRPLTADHPWVIPERYQEGMNPEYSECFLIRAFHLTYLLTNALMGPMAARAVRDYYAVEGIEWRDFHNYGAELEAQLKAAGWKLIEPRPFSVLKDTELREL